MREIKFRAFVKHLGQLADVLSIDFLDSEVEIYLVDRDEIRKYRFGEDEIVLLPFTGLKDKNGKEIYEGDLLRHPNGTIAEIRYLNDLAAFVAVYVQNSNTEMDYLDKEIVSKCKIVGNIYENPELLEGTV